MKFCTKDRTRKILYSEDNNQTRRKKAILNILFEMNLFFWISIKLENHYK